jgi:hypothetical protein
MSTTVSLEVTQGTATCQPAFTALAEPWHSLALSADWQLQVTVFDGKRVAAQQEYTGCARAASG